MEQETKTYVLKRPTDEAVSRKLSIDYAAALNSQQLAAMTAGVRSPHGLKGRKRFLPPLSGSIPALLRSHIMQGRRVRLTNDATIGRRARF
jgi:hypothetical protein